MTEEYTPNPKNWKIFIISLIFAIICLWIIYEILIEGFSLKGGLIIQIIIILMAIKFVYDNIFIKISEKLLIVFKAIETKQGILKGLEQTIPEATQQEKEQDAKQEMEKISKQIEQEEAKEFKKEKNKELKEIHKATINRNSKT